jgi:hypothetical protein
MSEIDELAYRLYLEYLATLDSDPDSSYMIAKKQTFIKFKFTNYKEHYDEAKKIIRKEKLKKLNESKM